MPCSFKLNIRYTRQFLNIYLNFHYVRNSYRPIVCHPQLQPCSVLETLPPSLSILRCLASTSPRWLTTHHHLPPSWSSSLHSQAVSQARVPDGVKGSRIRKHLQVLWLFLEHLALCNGCLCKNSGEHRRTANKVMIQIQSARSSTSLVFSFSTDWRILLKC